MMHTEEQEIIGRTREWVEKFVIGLNLCPFAGRPASEGRIRYALSTARGPAALYDDVLRELRALLETGPGEIETTLLVHPYALSNFNAYLGFLDVAEGVVEEAGLEGTIQIASFHPDYVFAGTAPGDVSNATNRSPYPMLHLLREDSVSEAVAGHPDPEGIPESNIRLMEKMGWEGVRAVFDAKGNGRK